MIRIISQAVILFFVNSNRMNEKGSYDTIIYLQDEEDDHDMLHACIIPTTTPSLSGIQPLCYTYIVAGSVKYYLYQVYIFESQRCIEPTTSSRSFLLAIVSSFIYLFHYWISDRKFLGGAYIDYIYAAIWTWYVPHT